MKKILFALTLPLLLAACSGPDADQKNKDITAKKAQLIIKKKELKALQDEIARMEKELAPFDTTAQNKVKIVSVTPAAPDTFHHYIEVQAKVEGDQDVVVSAEAMGNVTSLLVKPGDKVSKGQVMATIDDRILRTRHNPVQPPEEPLGTENRQ